MTRRKVARLGFPVLLSSDLDRTVIPNGKQPESTLARPLLRALANHAEVTLAYVTGRHRRLIQAAIEEYDLPQPDFAVGDVGTTLYRIVDGIWSEDESWQRDIAPDWKGLRSHDIQRLLGPLRDLELQEAEKQNTFKLSYYAPADTDHRDLCAKIRNSLEPRGIRASLVWSVDEQSNTGLLDVLPERATKLHAARFLIRRGGYSDRRAVFAGDSGNDLPALTSELQAVLVRNAADDVRREAQRAVATEAREDSLYVARGGYLGMNGYYAAGVLEGLVHFVPELDAWLSAASKAVD